jgi:hypothetical protein
MIMAPGVLHRAGVAIVLMATLLLPYGRCQSPRRAAAHDCCAHDAAPVASVKANCCTVRSELPAIVWESAAGNPNPLAMPAWFGPSATPDLPFETRVAATAPDHSPPRAQAVLRI